MASTGSVCLMSGSVANPREVADWLAGHGRDAVLVSELSTRSLGGSFCRNSLEETLCGRKVEGGWPKLVAGVLGAGMGPILLFAPRRKAAEDWPGTCGGIARGGSS